MCAGCNQDNCDGNCPENDALWLDSYCGACGKKECMGACPEYPEYERWILQGLGLL